MERKYAVIPIRNSVKDRGTQNKIGKPKRKKDKNKNKKNKNKK